MFAFQELIVISSNMMIFEKNREIARAAREQEACIISFDSDMFIMEEYGLILLKDVFENAMTKETDSDILVYSKKNSTMSKELFMFNAIMNNNDYFKGRMDNTEWDDWTKNPIKRLEYQIEFQRIVFYEKEKQQFETAWRKYDLDDYPDYPYNYLTDKKELIKPDNQIETGIEDILKKINGQFACSTILRFFFSPLYSSNLFLSSEVQRQCKTVYETNT